MKRYWKWLLNAMFAVKFADIYIDSSPSLNGIVTGYIIDNRLKWWYTRGIIEHFIDADVLFCESIKVIFWIHNTTQVFNSFENISLDIQLPSKEKIKDMLTAMYPGYRVYMYNKGFFNAVKKREISYYKEKIKAIPFDIISDIETRIFNKIAPEWIHFRRHIAKGRAARPANFNSAKELFYNNWTNLALLEAKVATSGTSANVIKNVARVLKNDVFT